MPTISRFHGITIQMYYAEHGVPHFHARHGGATAVIRVADLAVLGGGLPPAPMTLVFRWATEHSEELVQNWEAARSGDPLMPIAPLP